MYRQLIRLLLALLLAGISICLQGCNTKTTHGYQGYAEGDFVFVAAPYAGRLEKRWVERGQKVAAGEPLFGLEHANEKADLAGYAARLKTAEARFENLSAGLKPSEIDSLKAELAAAESDLNLSKIQLERQTNLFQKGYISKAQLDESQAAHNRGLELRAGLRAKLRTAEAAIGRDRELAAAKSEVESARAALAQSDWRLAQRAVKASSAALVQETFYSEGEWVPAGSPVVSLLPPGNIKLRFFVPEAVLGSVSIGQKVVAQCNGCPSAVNAKVSFISAQPEYTPPVIYSREQRIKLVFLVEALPDASGAGLLHPGQPLDISLK